MTQARSQAGTAIWTAALAAATVLFPAAARAAAPADPSVPPAFVPVTTGETDSPEKKDEKKEEKKDATAKPKPARPEGWRAASAKLPNPWVVNVSIWVRSYVAFGTNATDRVGPFVSGVSPSFRLGPNYRLDLGLAWNGDSALTLYIGFRQFFFTGDIFSVWLTGGFMIPLEEETLNTGANLGIYTGPGFRWWLADGFGVYFEATPNYRLGLGLTLEGSVGIELGLF